MFERYVSALPASESQSPAPIEPSGEAPSYFLLGQLLELQKQPAEAQAAFAAARTLDPANDEYVV